MSAKLHSHPFLDRRFESINQFQTDRLGQLVTGGRRAGGLDQADPHCELRRLPRELLGEVVLGKGHRHGALLTRDHADQLLLEAVEERARPDHDRNVFSRTALECLAVDRPGKRHRHAIPALGLRLLALILEGPICSPMR